MPDPQSTDTFEIGLVMAGAISAGAYTAGVIDFSYEALDAWEAQKRADPANTPAHKVSIRVVTGASAGGMTAALIGSTVGRAVTPVKTPGQEPGAANPFYDAWVSQVDIVKLLTTDDLQKDSVRSVLNADALETLALRVFAGGTPLAERRPYFAPAVDLIMTITNVAGVPYAIKMVGHKASHGMRLHKDYLSFRIDGGDKRDPDGRLLVKAVPSADLGDPGWAAVRAAALASGAFPIGLAAKPIDRVGGDYARRILGLPDAGGGPQYVRPDWELEAATVYKIGGIDGGMMDNEPLELARQALSGGPSLRNPPEAENALRAVLMIDPFPDSFYLSAADADKPADIGLTDILSALIPAFKNQARFKLDELQKAVDENIFSRFMIAPVRDGRYRDPKLKKPNDVVTGTTATIACGALGGFGGFLDRSFREHDYQLGRRNCQQFLRTNFLLPADEAKGRVNGVMKHWGTAPREGYVVRVPIDATGRYVADDIADELEQNAPALDRVAFLPIIPLMPSVAAEVPQPVWPTVTRAAMKDLLSARVHNRVMRVGRRLIDSTKLNPVKRSLFKLLLQLLDGNIVDYALSSVTDSLDANLQLADPPPPTPTKTPVTFGPHR